MKPIRIASLVIGSLLALPALAMLFFGALLSGLALGQQDSGYVEVGMPDLNSPTAAVTAERIDLEMEPDTPRWLIDVFDTDVRLRVRNVDSDEAVFVGIAPESDLDRYLAGVGHDEIQDIVDDTVVYESRSGLPFAPGPADQDFWAASAVGRGEQVVEWSAESGQWAVAVMNADGSAGIASEVDVGFRSDAFLIAALGLFLAGAALATAAVVLIVVGGLGLGDRADRSPPPSDGAEPVPAAPSMAEPVETPTAKSYQVRRDGARRPEFRTSPETSPAVAKPHEPTTKSYQPPTTEEVLNHA